jgi:hypothetical protein
MYEWRRTLLLIALLALALGFIWYTNSLTPHLQ